MVTTEEQLHTATTTTTHCTAWPPNTHISTIKHPHFVSQHDHQTHLSSPWLHEYSMLVVIALCLGLGEHQNPSVCVCVCVGACVGVCNLVNIKTVVVQHACVVCVCVCVCVWCVCVCVYVCACVHMCNLGLTSSTVAAVTGRTCRIVDCKSYCANVHSDRGVLWTSIQPDKLVH